MSSRQLFLGLTGLVFEKPGKLRGAEMADDMTEGFCTNLISMDCHQIMMVYFR
jgi:hypothetical protein